jgi:hypothetical protein
MCTRISELVLGGGAQRENGAAELRSDETSCVASKSPASDAMRKGGYECRPILATSATLLRGTKPAYFFWRLNAFSDGP